jgi:hypothetical protein
MERRTCTLNGLEVRNVDETLIQSATHITRDTHSV